MTVVGLGDMHSKLVLRSDDTQIYFIGKNGIDFVPFDLST